MISSRPARSYDDLHHPPRPAAHPTLIGITLLTFLLIRLAPGNAALIKGGGGEGGGKAMTAANREAHHQALRSRQALVHRLSSIGSAAAPRSIWAASFVDHRHRPVRREECVERLPISISIAGSAIFLSYLIAIPHRHHRRAAARDGHRSFDHLRHFRALLLPQFPSPRFFSSCSSRAAITSTCCRCTASIPSTDLTWESSRGHGTASSHMILRSPA